MQTVVEMFILDFVVYLQCCAKYIKYMNPMDCYNLEQISIYLFTNMTKLLYLATGMVKVNWEKMLL